MKYIEDAEQRGGETRGEHRQSSRLKEHAGQQGKAREMAEVQLSKVGRLGEGKESSIPRILVISQRESYRQ